MIVWTCLRMSAFHTPAEFPLPSLHFRAMLFSLFNFQGPVGRLHIFSVVFTRPRNGFAFPWMTCSLPCPRLRDFYILPHSHAFVKRFFSGFFSLFSLHSPELPSQYIAFLLRCQVHVLFFCRFVVVFVRCMSSSICNI